MGYAGAVAAIACYLPLGVKLPALKSGGARRLTVVVHYLVGFNAVADTKISDVFYRGARRIDEPS